MSEMGSADRDGAEEQDEEEEEVQHDGASSSAESVAGSDSECADEADEEKQHEVHSDIDRLSTKEEVTEMDLVEDKGDDEERRGTGGGRIVTRGRGGVAIAVRDGDAGAGGMTDAILLLIVRFVLTGMHGVVVLKWVLGKVSEGLAWVVELGMLLLGQPPQSLPQTAATNSRRRG